MVWFTFLIMDIKEMLLDYDYVEAALDILEIKYSLSTKNGHVSTKSININLCDIEQYKKIIKDYNIQYEKTSFNSRIVKYIKTKQLIFFIE